MKVKIRDNLRHFESDDSNFSIVKGEEKILTPKDLRSYSIKYHLFNGNLQVVEGETLINIKHATILLSSELNPFCYGIEFGKFFKKNLDNYQTFWIDEDEITNKNPNILNKLIGRASTEEKVEEVKEITPKVEEKVEEVKEIKKEKYTKTDLMDMNKVEQYEILMGFGLLKSEIKKLGIEADRVKKILELQEE